MPYDDLTLICPDNDTEAHTILGIAQKLGIDTRISPQPHGARLELEPEASFQHLKKRVAIVEIPGPEIEDKLRAQGHEVIIIDHHQYIDRDLDRRKPISSLEQFAELAGYQLTRFEMGIGIADRGYIYGLVRHGYSREEIEEILEYSKALDHDDDNKDHIAHAATLKAHMRDGIHILELPSRPSIGIALASKEIILNNLPEVQNILIIHRNEKGETTKIKFSGEQRYVEKLKALGGWSGGDPEASMYWGTDKDILPEVEALLFAA